MCALGSARRGSAGRVGSVPRLARTISLAMMVGFTSAQTICTNTCNYYTGTCDDGGPGAEYNVCAYGSDCVDCGPRPQSRLTLCSSGCGACTYGPVTLTSGGTPNQWANEYYYMTIQYYTCSACSGVASGGQMHVYQAFDVNGYAMNGYLWFDCSNGRWTRSVVPAGNSACPDRFACTGPYPTGTTLEDIPWRSCPTTGAQACSASSPPPRASPPPLPSAMGLCTNTCILYASDGVCDDAGPGAEYSDCSIGTDCNDCGPRWYFAVTSGPCTVDPNSPNCIRSPNFPSNYADSQACSITPTALALGRPLTATSFNTEGGFDFLRIPSHPSGMLTAFSGETGPSNFVLGPGTIQWSSDSSVTSSGWRVCSSPASHSHSPPPPPAQTHYHFPPHYHFPLHSHLPPHYHFPVSQSPPPLPPEVETEDINIGGSIVGWIIAVSLCCCCCAGFFLCLKHQVQCPDLLAAVEAILTAVVEAVAALHVLAAVAALLKMVEALLKKAASCLTPTPTPAPPPRTTQPPQPLPRQRQRLRRRLEQRSRRSLCRRRRRGRRRG